MAVAVAFEAEEAGRLERLSPPSAELVAAWTLGSHQASERVPCDLAKQTSLGPGKDARACGIIVDLRHWFLSPRR